ncbi:MAG: hypothetical protein JSS66_12430 [Armatimonadetes bacterium]|nr:hypothetical protein [Armatimonadota bacterium]
MVLSGLAYALLGLTVRVAKVDLTPPEPLPLGGYTARKGAVMEPGGQRLYARAVDFNGDTLVALDMLTVPGGFTQQVRSLVGDDRFVLIATHTHCAPDSQMLNPKMTFQVPGIASYSPFWSAWYADEVAYAIDRARSAAPRMVTKLGLSTGQARLNHGRRPDAVPDRTAWLLESGGTPLLASYPAHATFHDESWNKTDGDWPGVLAKRLDAPVIPAAIGDLAPEAPGKTPVEKCAKFVEKFLASVLKSEPRTVAGREDAPKLWREEVRLDPPKPHPGFAKAYGVPDALAQVLVTRFAEGSAAVTFFKVGNFLLIGVPGEPTAELGRRIGAIAATKGFPHALVASHADGWVGYVLMPEDYDRGGYEATLSFNGRETAQRMLEAVERGLSATGRGFARAGSSDRRAAS